MIAPTSPIRAPVRMAGKAAGITTLTSAARAGVPSAAADHSSRGSICEVPAAAARRMGNSASENPKAIFDAEPRPKMMNRSEEHTSELQSLRHLVCRLLLEKNDEQGGVGVLALELLRQLCRGWINSR